MQHTTSTSPASSVLRGEVVTHRLRAEPVTFQVAEARREGEWVYLRGYRLEAGRPTAVAEKVALLPWEEVDVAGW